MSGDNGIPIATIPKYRPTKKGIALNIARLPELIDALKEAEAEAQRRGMLS